MPDSRSDQKHPQERQDKQVVNRLLQEGVSPLNQAELARLLIRYRDFPGARELQKDLQLLLNQWQLTEETLFAITRQLHATGNLYRSNKSEEQQDWS